MIVTVVSMRMVQAASHQVIQMITVRDGLMAALWAVDMLGVMSIRAMRAGVGICFAHFDDVFVHMISVGMMKMSIVQIIRVALMLDGSVTATRAVLMGMIRMFVAFAHKKAFLVRWSKT